MNEVMSLLTGRVRSTAREYMVSAISGAVLALLSLTAYVALVYALALAVAAEAGPVVPSLSVAGVSVAVMLVIWLTLHIRRKRIERRRRMRVRNTTSAVSGTALATLVPMMVRASPVGSLVAVGVIAYVLSRAGQGGRRER